MAYHTSSTQGLRYLYTPPLHKIGARFNLPTLSAANGTSMRTWGKRTLSLVLDSKRQYTHQFYLADVTRPILGADFFTANGLAIDLRGKRPLSLDNVSFLLKESQSSPTLFRCHFKVKKSAFQYVLVMAWSYKNLVC